VADALLHFGGGSAEEMGQANTRNSRERFVTRPNFSRKNCVKPGGSHKKEVCGEVGSDAYLKDEGPVFSASQANLTRPKG
jgi:hypothetical protein